MVLILSENGDASTNSVIDWLNFYKVAWFRINEDDQVSLSCLEYKQDKLEKFDITVNGNSFDLISISSYWFRRGFLNFTEQRLRQRIVADEAVQINLMQYLDDEIDNLKAFIHSYLRATKRQLNSFITAANDKTFYQFIAAESGLSVPDTLISNKKRDLIEFSENKESSLISKSINEGFSFNFQDEVVYSTTYSVSNEDIHESPTDFFPSLFQENIAKYLELRIFYLDEEMYSMAIFSQQNEKTKLDFRNYDYDRPNRCVPFQLPEEIELKITRFMTKINLNCGSIDMILTPEGRYMFLEVNPVGQFGMVSYPCNYFLEQKIAKYLIYGGQKTRR